MITISLLPWDTDFFGYKVGKISASHVSTPELSDSLGRARKEGYRLIYWYVNPSDTVSNTAARDVGGYLADEKVQYVCSTPKVTESITSEISSYLHKSLNNNILSLALQSGEFSRYHIDPHFVHGEFKNLYTTWIENSLAGKNAKDVLMFLKDKKEVGLITLGTKNDRLDIGLLAVDKNVRGQSIGTKLMSAAFIKAKEWGFDKVQVVTQKQNIVAGSFYEKYGFIIELIDNVYHFWFN